MRDRPRFGPAGIPPAFKRLRKSIVDVPKFLRDEGLDALEYQAVRWGLKPQINRKEAEGLGENCERNDVLLTIHASYFINLCGEAETIEASKGRLLACATAADWMGADIVVFHPGYYGRRSKEEASNVCAKAMSDVVEMMNSMGMRNVKLGPETTGKLLQLGSLDEVISLCERVERTTLVVDWAHLYSRERGGFESVDDFRRVIDEVERRLGSNAVKSLHCHFTRVEFTKKGERRHRTMDEVGYGPNFKPFASLIAELGLSPVIISESPVLDVDAQKMRDITLKELELKGTSRC